MRFFLLCIALSISSCASKFKSPIVNEKPIISQFEEIDSNKDLFISEEEYQEFTSVGYNSGGPIMWFFIILFLVFLFSIFLAYLIRRK